MKKTGGRKPMTQAERNKRREAVGKAATEKIIKSEQLNFRISRSAIRSLVRLARERGLPLTTMVHDWVIERLLLEKAGRATSEGKALKMLEEIHGKLHGFLQKD